MIPDPSTWVHGDGPVNAPITFAAEWPGAEEQKRGIGLVGPSGQANWHIAARHGHVYRQGNYVTNWAKVPVSDADKKRWEKDPEEAEEWNETLRAEIATIQSPLVVALGSYPVRALLGASYNTYWANGVPVRREGVTVIPVVNAAAGFHQPDMLAKTVQGYQAVRKYLAGEIEAREWGVWAPEPETKVFYGQFWEEPTDVVAIDTEGLRKNPYCLTYSIPSRPTQSGLVWAEDLVGLAGFKAWLDEHRPKVILQNALHDAGVLRAMGIEIWDYEVVDTLVYAYNLQDIPRDLKNMSRRLLNQDMQDYEELVKPYQDAADQAWRERAAAAAWKRVDLVQQLTPKGAVKLSKGQPVYKKVGEQVALDLIRHYERGEEIQIDEQTWAELQPGVGRRPGLDLDLVPRDQAIPYAGKDSSVTLRVEPLLSHRIDSEGLREVADLDNAVLPLIEDMQNSGLHMDIEKYWSVLGDVSTRRRELEEEIRELVALEFPYHEWPKDKFNPGSADQVAAFCKLIHNRDNKLGLVKKTEGGKDATDNNTLSQLKDDHPFINLELEYKEVAKYEDAFLLPMKDYIRKDEEGAWRVYFNLRATTVVSGRLSAHSPNVLAWPARTKLGLRLRSIFTAPPGYVLGSWDLSQIELRLAAWASKDPVMLDAFQRGLDLHTNLASKIFGVAYESVDKSTQRYPTKLIHYLLLYGGGGDKLFEELRGMGITRYSREECFGLISETWKVYSGVRDYMRSVGAELRDKGYVSDFLGRRRFLPGAQLPGEWPMKSLRLEAERQAGNFKFQAGAAELLKRTMRTVWTELYPEARQLGHKFRLWLQVHDELFGQVKQESWEWVSAKMRAAMTQDSWLTAPVPIETEGTFGANWAELK